MEEAIKILPRDKWPGFNRVWKQKKVYFYSQMLHCDGTTVDTEILSTAPRPPSNMIFSYEEPTSSDFITWRQGIIQLTSPSFHHSPCLGKFLRRPYDKSVWYTNTSRDHLVREDD